VLPKMLLIIILKIMWAQKRKALKMLMYKFETMFFTDETP
jgi:hypothetical protein